MTTLAAEKPPYGHGPAPAALHKPVESVPSRALHVHTRLSAEPYL